MEHQFDKLELLSYHAGDVAAEKKAAMDRHVASCMQCRQYLASLDAEKSAFLAAHPFAQTAAQWNSKPGKRLVFVPRQVYALAASLILCLGAGYLYIKSMPEPGYRIKGETTLKVFVKNLKGDIEKRSTQNYVTGEKIQFLYSCGPKNQFALFSLDTAGGISTYFPASGDTSLSLERGQDIPLPNSIALDEYTGREVFIGVFSEKPFLASRVLEQLKASFAASRSIDFIALDRKDLSTVSILLTVLPEKH
jgi:hypothetical protein